MNEFFFEAGVELGDEAAQQDYISANYTHARRYIISVGVNLVGQLVARRGDRFNLSCNTDITLDLLRARGDGRADFIMAGQVNSELPFMPGEAEVPAGTFAMMLEGPGTDLPLFAPPNAPVEAAHYAQGLHAAALVPDGGSLQLGIGSTSDAVVQALILRHRNKTAFSEALGWLPVGPPPADDHSEPFETGLYAPTEMFVCGFLALMQAGILKREVDGAVLHGGFILGPRAFYRALRELPDDQRARLHMTAISFVNERNGQKDRKRAARTGGRFINTAMMRPCWARSSPTGSRTGASFPAPAASTTSSARPSPSTLARSSPSAPCAASARRCIPTSSGAMATPPSRGIFVTSSSPNTASRTFAENRIRT